MNFRCPKKMTPSTYRDQCWLIWMVWMSAKENQRHLSGHITGFSAYEHPLSHLIWLNHNWYYITKKFHHLDLNWGPLDFWLSTLATELTDQTIHSDFWYIYFLFDICPNKCLWFSFVHIHTIQISQYWSL